jgi:hypothetical protein
MSKLSRLRAYTQALAPEFDGVSSRLDWSGSRLKPRRHHPETESDESRHGALAPRASGVPMSSQRPADVGPRA